MRKKITAFLLLAVFIGASLIATPSAYANSQQEMGYFIKAERNRVFYKKSLQDSRVFQVPFDENTSFMIDERQVSIGDFQKEMDIYMEIERGSGRLKHMDTFSTTSPGHILPGSKQRTGTVKMIDRDQIVITTAIDTEETYFTGPATLILQDGENIDLSRLYVGDRVKLYFDDIDTSIASKVEIEGSSVLIKDLYKGEIAVTNKMSSSVTFSNMNVFRNGNWSGLKENEEDLGIFTLPYNSKLPLYVAGEKIDYRNMEYYKGKTVYIALKDHFGRDSAEKMVIKNQNETTFSDKIENVNWYTSEIELTNKRNIGFHDGTMVVKNGRIVDNFSIVPNASVFVVADGASSGSTANVIYIYDEDINNSNIGVDRIYAGRVDSLSDYKLDLKDFSVLDKNKWESFAETKELVFDNDTSIYDLEQENEEDREITAQEFLSGEYHIDEDNISPIDKEKNSKDYNAYIYTKGDRIAAIYLMKDMDSLLRQAVTTAVVEKTPVEDVNMGWTMVVRDAKDWSQLTDKWTIKHGSMNLRIKDAMIMKNGKSIDKKDLQQGDRLYLVRDDLVGKVIVVK